MEALVAETLGSFFIMVVGIAIVVGLIRLIIGPMDTTRRNNYNDDTRSKFI